MSVVCDIATVNLALNSTRIYRRRMLWRVWVVVLVGCGAASTTGPTKLDMAAQFVSADPAALQQIVRKPVGSGGLWFHDMDCARQFSLPGEIVASQLTSFARCLSGLQVRLSDRRDPLSDVVVLTYDPGIEIEARFLEDEHGPWLAWIGFESRRDLRDGLPTISTVALEVLRSSGSRDGTIDDATGAPLLAHAHAFNQKSEFAWIKMCLDADGIVTGAHVRRASSIATTTRLPRSFSSAASRSTVCGMSDALWNRGTPPNAVTMPW